MRKEAEARIEELIRRYPVLQPNRDSIAGACERIAASYRNGGRLLICGNGGSAADSLHITGELLKAFVLPRPLPQELKDQLNESAPDAEYLIENLQMPLRAVSLVSEAGLMTAYANDVAPDMNFAQQVLGQGREGDVLLAISTSGNSENVLYAAQVARALKMTVIGLTGMTGGRLKKLSDICITAGETETFKIQELHLPIYHAICLALEAEFFS